ncbi:tetratricopeptide repeat protein 37-like isoform X2 [Anneissia japonica]|uniref:tetratricopeptide repeat protein 37-like isoform X2 n=1 Tax=Anneissia japonica TaxID=1529436 RepID=UPI0014256432|nr:tetratricopeptide repeat protein 37-like isoform X2 [Anneissia japonica]
MASGSNKEVKAWLKSAREAIKNKEYKDALRHCKAVLKLEKTNYNAFVFIGKAATEMDQLDQARMAYKKATENDPNQLLAWQGLCDLCERTHTEENKATIEEAYEKMASILINSDKAKWLIVAQKQVKFYEMINDLKKVVSVIVDILEADFLENNSAKLPYWTKVASILANQQKLSADEEVLLERAYTNLLEMIEDESSLEETFVKFVDLLKKKHDSDQQVLEVSQKMQTRLPSSIQPLQALVQVYLTQNVCIPEAIEAFQQLETMEEKIGLASLGLGKIKLEDKKYIEAKVLLEKGVKAEPGNIHGWLYISKAKLAIHDNDGVEKATQKGLKLLKRSARWHHLKELFLFLREKSMVDRATHTAVSEAIDTFKELQNADSLKVECTQCLVESYCVLGQLDEAQKYCKELLALYSNNVLTNALTGWIAGLQGKYDEAEKMLSEAITNQPDNARLFFWLGRVQWDSGEKARMDRSKCLSNFMKAAKLDPYNSGVFQYLGHYYHQIANDNRRAKSCFKKSFDLNIDNAESGTAFADLCIATADEESALSMLKSVTSQAAAGTAKWAWLRLGLYQLKNNDAGKAVTSFQAALRADTKDSRCWECMGEAYQCRGSYTAALKAFTRALELDGASVYCQYQIASIKQTLGQYTDAVSDYCAILSKQEGYIPALKGLGETYLLLAKDSLVDFLNGRAVDYVCKSITTLQCAISLRPDLSCLWKLLGDSCTILHPLDPELVSVHIPAVLKDGTAESNSLVHVGKKELLAIGARCYGKALQLLPDCASLWHDLGSNYLRQAQCNTDEATALGNKAVQCLKKAVSLDSSNNSHWNALGTACSAKEIDLPKLAQHALIKAIQIEENDVVAWTNLGALYLKHDDIKMAHQAFKKSQSINPDYVQCWIGQAHIAESIQDHETMDLFRHTCELGSHIEGTIGYGHWVCKTLLDGDVDVTSEHYKYSIEQMNAVSTSSLAVSKFTDRVRDNACSYNMLGLLMERQGLHQQSMKAFKRSIDLLSDNDSSDLLNKARANYARSLCMNKQYNESLLEYRMILPLIVFEDVCGLALALYKAGRYDESYQAYEQALQLTDNVEDKGHVLCAMGMVTQSPEQAKTVLFQCSQLSPPSVDGLLALCALAITHKDVELASAALTELLKFANDPKMVEDVCFMAACVSALQGQGKLAYQQISKAVHRHPSNAKLWNKLSHFLLQLSPDKSKAAARCSKIASNQGFDSSKDLSIHMATAMLFSGQHVKKLDRSCLISAQKSVHLYPENTAAWTVLSASQLAEAILHGGNTDGLTSRLAQFILQCAESDCDVTLQQWSALHLASAFIQDGHYQEARTFCQNEAMTSDPVVSSIFNRLEVQAVLITKPKQDISETDVEILKKCVLGDANKALVWQILAQLYEEQCIMDAAEGCYSQALICATVDKAVPLVRLAVLALHNALQGSDAREHWVSLLLEATSEALKIDEKCSVAWLIQGCLHYHTGEPRQAKWCFQQAKECTDNKASVEAKVARFYLTKLLIAKGNKDAAQAIIEEASIQEDDTISELMQLLNQAV